MFTNVLIKRTLKFSGTLQIHLLQMNKLICLFALAMSISSCSTIYTQEYMDLEHSVDRNPQSDAIIGMWNRRSYYTFGPRVTADGGAVPGGTLTSNSILFRSNQTGVTKWTSDDPDPILGWLGTGDVAGEIGDFTWEYVGGGVWNLKNSKGRIDECRIAQGKLLRKFQFLGTNHLVYERID